MCLYLGKRICRFCCLYFSAFFIIFQPIIKQLFKIIIEWRKCCAFFWYIWMNFSPLNRIFFSLFLSHCYIIFIIYLFKIYSCIIYLFIPYYSLLFCALFIHQKKKITYYCIFKLYKENNFINIAYANFLRCAMIALGKNMRSKELNFMFNCHIIDDKVASNNAFFFLVKKHYI